MRPQWYVGIKANADGVTQRYETFRAVGEVTEKTHGDKYLCAIGPFRTKRGAEYMARYGRGNPHCRTVADAEWLAKLAEIKARMAR